MKKLFIFFMMVGLVGVFASCSKADFSDAYANPSTISSTTVEKQFAGFMSTNREYVLPAYWNYFVVLRTTLTRYTQAVGWENASSQYVPGFAGINARWDNYYNMLAQYRELQKVYNALSSEDQNLRRIYMIAASIYFYDHTQRHVDLHGDVPWSEAGMLSTNGGNYLSSLPKYDEASTIYTKMLDDLKGFADELDAISINSGIQTGFSSQDYINKGNVTKWKMYCNSLRMRMLARVSDVSTFQSRVTAEAAAIMANPTKYPVVTSNDNNIQINVTNLSTPINSSGFRSGLEDWNGNIASKAIIDHMKANTDPRLRAVFEPGLNAGGEYIGLDPLLTGSVQNALIAGGTLAIYNRSTLSRNQYFPGVLINASEVSFLAAEALLKAGGNDALAKAAYEDGIKKSIEFYYWVRTISNDNVAGDLTTVTPNEISNYLNSPGVDWDVAATVVDKMKLIATQKWLHFNVVQPYDNWAEIRRLNAPTFSFEVDNSNAQTLPPKRWLYAGSEQVYNTDNYESVRSRDNLTTALFWDVN